jgi:hypothetical protein
MVAFSNIQNRYQAAEESVYGTTPIPFTLLDWGHIQRITVGEEENSQKLAGINSGHLYALFEDGLYFVNVSIETIISKAALPNLLEACCGSRSDSTDYTITTSKDYNSYSLKVSHTDETTGDIILINGFTVKDFEISITKGETITLTMNGIAKKAAKSTASISVTTNTDKVFMDLDAKITVGGNTIIANSFTLSGNWNATDDEGRGIEDPGVGERRLLQRFTKHVLDLNGSYEALVSDNDEFGYTEERTDEAIVLTINRGTDNEHVFTMSNTRSFNREKELTRDNSLRVVSYDYEALNVSITGDL